MAAPLEVPDVQLVPVTDLERHPDNPRQGDVGAIIQSIEAHGFYGTIIAQASSRRVLAGNHRLEAARQLGIDAVPVIYLDVDDDQAQRILLVDNRTNDLATYDDSALTDLLQQLMPDLSGTGFDAGDLDDLLADLDPGTPGADTDPIEPPDEPTTKLGDLWILGDHRLLCGDATDLDAVGRLMAGARAQLVYTDPPYGVDYDGGQNTKKRTKLAGDEIGTTIYTEALPTAWAYSDDEAPLYLWFAGSKGNLAYSGVAATGYTVRALLIWHKLSAHYGAFMSQYMPKHEPMLYCVKGKTRWHGPTNEVTVWEYAQPSANEYHPTQKPVEIAERAITNSTAAGDLALDLFGGSGSTLIACENLGRYARLTELDPAYCDVIIDRWQRHTGQTATLEAP